MAPGIKQVIVVRQDLKMGKGKLAAQAAHASVEGYRKACAKEEEWAREWLEQGMPKIVVKVQGEKELLELFEQAKKRVPAALIQDAGRTQVEPGTKTAIALGPAPESLLDPFTGKLKLL